MNTHGSQASLLETIEDNVVYVMENLLHDYTGEAKFCLTTTHQGVMNMEGLDANFKDVACSILKEIHDLLSENGSSREARDKLINLRHRITNTRMMLLGRAQIYNYAPPFGAFPSYKSDSSVHHSSEEKQSTNRPKLNSARLEEALFWMGAAGGVLGFLIGAVCSSKISRFLHVYGNTWMVMEAVASAVLFGWAFHHIGVWIHSMMMSRRRKRG